ncbi:hypothetical protein [Alkalihalobacillus sp. LMS39]|uniref:hypothetical protein n=1 Tax=Alkalihalobacillus sp. LMS39 TaxID=2924032 RepID=UPI001FB48CF5|nr:hypothetical protein [Alkalihalobacillus sp. LMS39]UOE95854.1 hypothetical protein MM271_09745 [Alkalihalobacillus sp. LMS39]
MKRIKISLVSLGFLIFIFISIVYVWNNGTPFGKDLAIEYALDLISEEHEMEEQELVLFGTKYFRGKGHYTILDILD